MCTLTELSCFQHLVEKRRFREPPLTYIRHDNAKINKLQISIRHFADLVL